MPSGIGFGSFIGSTTIHREPCPGRRPVDAHPAGPQENGQPPHKGGELPVVETSSGGEAVFGDGSRSGYNRAKSGRGYPVAKVLIVDDEPNIREVVGLYLRRDGHDVVSASDGEEALEAFQSAFPISSFSTLCSPRSAVWRYAAGCGPTGGCP